MTNDTVVNDNSAIQVSLCRFWKVRLRKRQQKPKMGICIPHLLIVIDLLIKLIAIAYSSFIKNFKIIEAQRFRSQKCCCSTINYFETIRCVDMPMSKVTPVIILYIHPPHQRSGRVMAMNDPLTTLLFHAKWPIHPWDKVILNVDLENSRPWSWVWSKGKVTQSVRCPIDLLPFYFTAIRPTLPELELFKDVTLEKSKVKVKGQGHIVDQPIHFIFASRQSDQPFLRCGQWSVWPWKNIRI